MNIYKVGAVLHTSINRNPETHDYFDMYVYKYKAKELPNTYEFYDESRLRKLKKKYLNKWDSKYLDELYSSIAYFTYCKEDDIENTKVLLTEKIKIEIEKRKVAYQRLEDRFNNGFEFDERDYSR